VRLKGSPAQGAQLRMRAAMPSHPVFWHLDPELIGQPYADKPAMAPCAKHSSAASWPPDRRNGDPFNRSRKDARSA